MTHILIVVQVLLVLLTIIIGRNTFFYQIIKNANKGSHNINGMRSYLGNSVICRIIVGNNKQSRNMINIDCLNDL